MKKIHKGGKMAALVILAVLILVVFLLIAEYGRQKKITLSFSENKAVLNNPSRGFYAQIDAANQDLIKGYYEDEEENFRLLLVGFNLVQEIGQDQISQEKIAELTRVLNTCREVKMQVIFRASYHFWGDEYDQPDDFSRILAHAEQIFPVINEYPDVVLGVQAGFIGPYGEWHSSSYMESQEGQRPDYIRLLEKLDQVIDKNIAIDVRRPMFIREAEAAGISIDRIGFHNDALLSTDTDMGTYVEEGYTRADELSWVQEHIKTPINGGELTNVSAYTDVANAVVEFDQLNLTYLNRYYNTEVLDAWKTQTYEGENGFDYIKNHLGYRLSLKEITLPQTIGIGQKLDLEGIIRNTGFARPQEGFMPYLVTAIGQEQSSILLEQDAKKEEEWEISGQQEIAVNVIAAEKNPDIRLGIMVKKSTEKGGDLYIQFAGEETEFTDGCNWFASYHYDKNKKKYVLSKE